MDEAYKLMEGFRNTYKIVIEESEGWRPRARPMEEFPSKDAMQ